MYNGNLSIPTAELTTVKVHLNSTISTPGARYTTINIKDFYLGITMAEYEYMRIPLSLIPQVIVDQYNLLPLVHNGFVMVEVRKGMYGLPQAGILANKQLRTHLATQGYHHVPIIPGLFTHRTHDISFTLVVDNFGVKYTSRADFNHLVATIKQKYIATIDRSGVLYCGLTLAWNYAKRYVDISMPGYIQQCLARFAPHPAIKTPTRAARMDEARLRRKHPDDPALRHVYTAILLRHNRNTRSGGHNLVLRARHRLHRPRRPWIHWLPTIKAHGNHSESHRPSSQLCHNTP